MVNTKSLFAAAVSALGLFFANASSIPNNLDVNGDGEVNILDGKKPALDTHTHYYQQPHQVHVLT